MTAVLYLCETTHTREVSDTVFHRIERYGSSLVEMDEIIVHEYHAILLGCLEYRVHVLSIATDYEIADRVTVEHDLTHDHTSSLILAW